MMKKKLVGRIISLVLALVLCCACGLTSFAFDELNAHYGPDGNTNSWASTRNDPSKLTATQAPVMADDVYFYWKPSTARPLPYGFKASNSRQIKINLRERDAFSNDDYPKYYEGSFDGLYVGSISFIKITESKELEVGKSVELYIEQYVTSVSGDTRTDYTSLFSYYCSIM